MTTETATTIVKSVKYNRDTRDYAGYLAIDGQVIIDQDFKTAQAAQSAVDNAAYDYLAQLDTASSSPAPVEPEQCYHCDRLLAAGESEVCAACYVDPTSTPVAAPITRAAVLAAVSRAREACQDSTSWFSAVSKAAVELDLGRWLWDGSRLVIGSRTNPGKRYTVTADACTCGHRCKWHKAAYRILSLASQPAR